MNIGSLAKTAAKIGMGVFADTDVTFKRISGTTFDPEVGNVNTYEEKTVKAKPLSFKIHEVDGDKIKYGDRKLVVEFENLQGFGQIDTDTTVSFNGETWGVVTPQWIEDALLIIQIRKVSK